MLRKVLGLIIFSLVLCWFQENAPEQRRSSPLCIINKPGNFSLVYSASHSVTTQLCTSGDVSGNWIVSCQHREGCRNANLTECGVTDMLYRAARCSYVPYQELDLTFCLRGMTIIFFGDSTLRGIMYALVEYLNGSLTLPHKYHGIAIFDIIHASGLSVHFGYGYPRTETNYTAQMQDLINRTMLTSRDKNVLIVIGGTSLHLLDHISSAFRQKNAFAMRGYNVQVAVKSLNAGHSSWNANASTAYTRHQQAAKQKEFLWIDTWNPSIPLWPDLVTYGSVHWHREEMTLGSLKITGPVNAHFLSRLLQALGCKLRSKNTIHAPQ